MAWKFLLSSDDDLLEWIAAQTILLRYSPVNACRGSRYDRLKAKLPPIRPARVKLYLPYLKIIKEDAPKA